MLARTHKPLAIVNQYQLLANSTAVSRPLCFIPLQQWTQWSVNSTNPNRDQTDKSQTKPTEYPGCVRSCESETSITSKKLFVVAPSRSLSSVEKKHVTPPPEEPICSNPLPPKPKVEHKSPPASDRQSEEQLNRVKASVTAWTEFLRNLNWRTALLTTKNKVAGAAGAIVAPGNVERVRHGVALAWDMSVRAVQNLIYWIRVFMDSREYYYLRYYTLLMVENTIYYARLGLIKIIELARNFKQ